MYLAAHLVGCLEAFGYAAGTTVSWGRAACRLHAAAALPAAASAAAGPVCAASPAV